MKKIYFFDRLLMDNISVDSYLKVKYDKDIIGYKKILVDIDKALKVMQINQQRMDFILYSCNEAEAYYNNYSSHYKFLIEEYEVFKRLHKDLLFPVQLGNGLVVRYKK